jgi:hypothetical protein
MFWDGRVSYTSFLRFEWATQESSWSMKQNSLPPIKCVRSWLHPQRGVQAKAKFTLPATLVAKNNKSLLGPLFIAESENYGLDLLRRLGTNPTP